MKYIGQLGGQKPQGTTRHLFLQVKKICCKKKQTKERIVLSIILHQPILYTIIKKIIYLFFWEQHSFVCTTSSFHPIDKQTNMCARLIIDCRIF